MQQRYSFASILLVACCVATLSACSQKTPQPVTKEPDKEKPAPVVVDANGYVELKHYAMNSLEGVLSQNNVAVDSKTTSDGNGSLRLESDKTEVFTLFEVPIGDIENSRLLYQAKLRAQDVKGKAYLEMRIHYPDKDELFSRNIQNALTGTQDWTAMETPFFLKPGEHAEHVKLNLVLEGPGTVWVDDVRLTHKKSMPPPGNAPVKMSQPPAKAPAKASQ